MKLKPFAHHYINTPETPAVYRIKDIINGGEYIGATANLRARWGCHVKNLYKNVHQSSKLQAAFNEHGMAAFELQIIEKKRNLRREMELIKKSKNCYNKVGHPRSGCRSPHACRFSPQDHAKMRKMREAGKTLQYIADIFGSNRSYVCRVMKGVIGLPLSLRYSEDGTKTIHHDYHSSAKAYSDLKSGSN